MHHGSSLFFARVVSTSAVLCLLASSMNGCSGEGSPQGSSAPPGVADAADAIDSLYERDAPNDAGASDEPVDAPATDSFAEREDEADAGVDGSDVDSSSFADGPDAEDASIADGGRDDDAPDAADALGLDVPNADVADSDAGVGSCSDGMLNGRESDVDCGGPACPPCEVGHACSVASDCKTGYCPRSICELASGPPYWVPGVPLTAPRANVAVAARPTGAGRGTILAIGGVSPPIPNSTRDDYEVFDPENASWSTAALPGPRSNDFAALGADGRIYLFGASHAATWSFDGAWTASLAPTPQDCLSPAPALGSDGLFYVPCQRNSSSKAIFLYDPARDAWSTSNQPGLNDLIPIPTAASMGTRIYVIGGATPSASFEAYDVATRQWSTLAPLFDRSTTRAVAGPDGRIYAVGGYTSSGDTDLVSAYVVEANRWAPVAPLRVPRASHGVTVGPDGRIYAIGGTSTAFATSATTTVDVYGPVVSVTPSSAAVGATVIVHGTNFGANATVHVYLGSTTGPLLATAKTNGAGALTPLASFTVPNATGSVAVVIIDDRSRYPVTVPLTVN